MLRYSSMTSRPRRQAVHETARVADRLGPQRLGQPRDRPGQRRPMPTACGGGGQVLVRNRRPAEGQGDPAGGQLRQRLVGRGDVSQLPDATLGIPEQGGGRRTSVDACAHLRQLGMGSPPAPTLPIEQLPRLGGPGQSRGGLTGGQRARGRGEQQFRPFGRPAVDLVQLADRGIGLLQGIPGQPCGRQRGAPVNAQIGLRCTQTLESLRRLVEKGQRLRQVAEPQGDQPPVHGGLR